MPARRPRMYLYWSSYTELNYTCLENRVNHLFASCAVLSFMLFLMELTCPGWVLSLEFHRRNGPLSLPKSLLLLSP